MKRKIIKIDEELCNGCGECITGCPEGAIQILEGKARLISDLFCDGLGACLGECPVGAITIEEREAESYDERKVMENMIPQGDTVIRAHLDHLKDHGEHQLLKEAMAILKEKNMSMQENQNAGHHHAGGGCPGSKFQQFGTKAEPEAPAGPQPSQLSHWPIQLHLISPLSPAFQSADVMLAADCVAFSRGDFHQKFLKGKSLAIACPKLDDGQDIYLEKLVALINDAKINTLTVMIMQVPCCGGLLRLAQEAVARANRKIPLKGIVVGIQGEILSEEWV